MRKDEEGREGGRGERRCRGAGWKKGGVEEWGSERRRREGEKDWKAGRREKGRSGRECWRRVEEWRSG